MDFNDFTKMCRTCLCSDSLNPIFSNILDHSRYTTAVYLTTGVQVDISDGLPQNMCSRCITQLNNCLKFRKQCKDTEKQLMLLKMSSVMKETNQEESQEMPEEEVDGVNIETEIIEVLSDDEVQVEMGSDDTKITTEVVEVLSDDDEELLIDIPVDKNDCGNLRNEDMAGAEIESILYKALLKSHRVCDRVTCRLCQKEFNARILVAHMARIHPRAEGKCKQCGLSIPVSKMDNHRALVHRKSKHNFNCKVLIERISPCLLKKKTGPYLDLTLYAAKHFKEA